MAIISVYVTFPDEKSAMDVSSRLLDEGLVACANSFPVNSLYVWDSVRQNDRELAVLFKSRPGLWPTLRKRIEQLHPYDVPAVIKYDVEANEAYENWVRDCTGGPELTDSGI